MTRPIVLCNININLGKFSLNKMAEVLSVRTSLRLSASKTDDLIDSGQTNKRSLT